MPNIPTEHHALTVMRRIIALLNEANEAIGWLVLPSYQIIEPAGQTDLDMTLFVPGLGVLIIEHKGWLNYIVDDNGRWTIDGTVYKDPYVQAVREEHLLAAVLMRFKEIGTQRISLGPLPRIGSVVLFGNLSHQHLNEAAGAIRPEHSLGYDDLLPVALDEMTLTHARTARDRIILRLRNCVLPELKCNNTPTRLREVWTAMAPECDFSGLSSVLLEQHGRMNRDAWRTQVQLANAIEDRAYVEGGAGTGKTVLALYAALARADKMNREALYICFSENLAAQIRAVDHLQGRNIRVTTPEGLLESVGGGSRLCAWKQEERDAEESALRLGLTRSASARSYLGRQDFWEYLLECFVTNGEYEAFSSIVLDEAQDFWGPAFAALEQLVAEHGQFIIFADPYQMTRPDLAGEKWRIPACVSPETGAQQITLSMNLRNGEAIIAQVLRSCPNVQYDRPPGGAHEADVAEIFYARNCLAGTVKARLGALRGAGMEPVLLVSCMMPEELTALTNLGVPFRTVDSFKGMEAKSVVFVRGTSYAPLAKVDEDVYVGLSRATVQLTVIQPQTNIVPQQ